MSNKYFATATWVLSILGGIVSLLFIFIEGRMLLFGDWLVYDNQILGFFSVSASEQRRLLRCASDALSR